MRFRLLRRRLTISAPRMAVRSSLPWPFRWAMLAFVLGICAAIGLWAFEFGKDIAGIEGGTSDDLSRIRIELANTLQQLETVKADRDKAQSVANTSTTLVIAEKANQERLLASNKQLEADNRVLREDLAFFEKLIPAVGGENLAIRGFQAEVNNGREVKWQILVIQPLKDAPEFTGLLELTFSGLLSGKPWSATLPGGSQSLKFKQYGRAQGIFELPPQVQVKSVSAKVTNGTLIKASQSIKL
jgi:hypothetical protein